MLHVIVREHKQVVLVYETMRELAEDRIHHAPKCGALVFETERRVMEHNLHNKNYDCGLRYVCWENTRNYLLGKFNFGKTHALPILFVMSVMFAIGKSLGSVIMLRCR